MLVLLLLSLVALPTMAHEGNQGHNRFRQHKPLQFNPKEARQREHLMGHLDDFVKRPTGRHDHAEGHGTEQPHQPSGGEEMQHMEEPASHAFSDEELEFHYFRNSDYDNNNMLDGLEILKALLEETAHRDGESSPEEPQPEVLSDQQLAELVDAVMAEQDFNGDGYIDYSEFAAVQRGARASPNQV